MDAFLDAAFSFPAVVFTILLVPVVLYWLLVMVGFVEIDTDADLDLDGDAGPDADADADADAGDGGPGWLTGWWYALGLASMPFTVALSLIVVFGWFGALVATGLVNVLEVAAVVRVLAGAAVLVLAFCFGALLASVAGRPLAKLFEVTHAESRSDFVGRTCVIRTQRVTADLGQAEAADPSGATVLIPVRPMPSLGPDAGGESTLGDGGDLKSSSGLHYGATALIVEYDRDAEVFLVSPLDGELRDAFDAGGTGGA